MRTIYFLQAESGPIKIGITNNLSRRLQGFTTHNHEKLNLIYSVEIEDKLASKVERGLHRYLENARIQGEWFWPHQVVLDAIANVKKGQVSIFLKIKTVKPKKPKKIKETITHESLEDRIPTSLAAQVGCSPWMIKKINAGTQPSLKLALRIVKAMGAGAPRLTDMIPDLKEAFEVMIRQGVG